MLRHSVTFRSPVSAQVSRASMIRWLQAIGYQMASAPFLTSFEMLRGTMAGNIGSLNPKNWRVKLRATFTPVDEACDVELEIMVTTTGQVITKADIAFWSWELGQTMAAACGAQPEKDEFRQKSQEAAKGDAWRAIAFTIIVVGTLVGSMILSENPYVMVSTTLLSIALGWMTFRAPRRLRINPPQISEPPVLMPE